MAKQIRLLMACSCLFGSMLTLVIEEYFQTMSFVETGFARLQRVENNRSSPVIDYINLIPPTVLKDMNMEHLTDTSFRIKRASSSSDKQLVLGAGRGTTGTKYMAQLVGNITGEPVTHWKNHNNMNSTTLNRFLRGCFYNLWKVNRTTASTFDYSCLGNFGGHFDVPIPNLFPYIFSYFPNSKVILTVRDSAEWVKKRGGRWAFRRVPAPFAMELTGLSFGQALDMKSSDSPVSMATMYNANIKTTEILYLAYNAMVKAIVPEKQLLIVNVFTEENDQIERRVREFLLDDN